ncbi:MAG: hypothetical protein QXM46_05325 [Candidatus Hadarchaeales archaeon]
MKEAFAAFLTASTLAVVTTVFWPECTLLWAVPAAVMLGIVAVSRKPGRR